MALEPSEMDLFENSFPNDYAMGGLALLSLTRDCGLHRKFSIKMRTAYPASTSWPPEPTLSRIRLATLSSESDASEWARSAGKLFSDLAALIGFCWWNARENDN